MRRRERLRRMNQRLRESVSRYRTLFTLSSAVAVMLALVLVGFVAFDTEEPVLLGVGTAGLKMADSTLVAAGLTPRPNLTARDKAAAPPVSAAEPAPVESTRGTPTAEERGRALGGGEASYYGEELAGNRTASGERFNPQHLTAAHRTLPLGSRVRVTNVRNGRSVVVRINDRGPFAKRRVIDLSKAAAGRIGMLASGTASVRIELLRS